MVKYNLPEWVKIYKDKGKSIKIKNNNYYLYETKCIYDKKRKNKSYTKNVYLYWPHDRIVEINNLMFENLALTY